MDINIFKNNLQKYAGDYNANTLFEKIKGAAKKMGIKVVYAALILYYATFDKDLPAKDRLMLLAALGYLILPLDLIPDALPGGFTDDMTALLFVLRQIWSNLLKHSAKRNPGFVSGSATSQMQTCISREWVDVITYVEP